MYLDLQDSFTLQADKTVCLTYQSSLLGKAIHRKGMITWDDSVVDFTTTSAESIFWRYQAVGYQHLITVHAVRRNSFPSGGSREDSEIPTSNKVHFPLDMAGSSEETFAMFMTNAEDGVCEEQGSAQST
ncbi:uncharacterized protein EV420DRAFT_1642576 [Desarmillaria tabescens]|uniref:Uncharacterized protein n=1 Tax=Armillaria tabescens TaxID=1929756 RepID=A0AA39N646_ARMTA|nr:uncharacterized protein EV420DRAFT_1642576 [Desarmillaria tabescens]KAK0458854.1 hypothetical protein EV420DRAFT_1642576 [Desarmillaria tabescens]